MKRIKIKPATGLIVRNPQRGFQAISATGEEVNHDSYFSRRIADGDVVEVKSIKKVS